MPWCTPKLASQQGDRPHVAQRVMVGAKNDDVRWNVRTVVVLTEGDDVVCFGVCRTTRNAERYTAQLASVAMQKLHLAS